MKGVLVAYPAHGGAQKIDFAHQQIIAMAFKQVDRKEPGAAGYEGAAVTR